MKPTLVIGAGMGGIKVVQTLADMAREDGNLDYYRFIAIDSSETDLQDKIKDKSIITTVPITEAKLNIEEYIQRCPYLPAGSKPKGTGAVRDRAYARFLLDVNMHKVATAVENSIGQLKKLWRDKGEKEKKEVLIWMVHTLGGGTGSGTFPTLVVNVSKQVNQLLDKSGITPIVYCVGVLPSAMNIQDISFLKFNAKYLANSFAALTELKQIAYPEDLLFQRFNSNDNSKTIKHRPFNRYFLYGLNEDLLSEMREDEADEVEDYPKSSNKVIASMMYTFSSYQGSLENLWSDVQSPLVTFGESELFVPLDEMKSIAAENDRLGQVLNENDEEELTQQARGLIDSCTKKGNADTLEGECRSVLLNCGLRGLGYYVGKVENEFNKEVTRRETAFKEEVSAIWKELENTEWAEDKIRNLSDTDTPGERYEKILELFEGRIEENEETINSSLPRIFLKRQLKQKNKDMSATCERLKKQNALLEHFAGLKTYIRDDLCNSLQDEIGQESNGVRAVVARIRGRESSLENRKRWLLDSGHRRVVKLGVPKEYVDTLSLVRETNVSNISSVQAFISKFDITKKDLNALVTNRLEECSPAVLRIAVVPGKDVHDIDPFMEIFTLCNSEDEPLLAENDHQFTDYKQRTKINPEGFDAGRYIFISFHLGLHLEDISEYAYRKQEYLDGQLSQTTKTPRIGTIFAHPEWFPDDPNVQAVFPNLKSEQ